MPPPTTFKRLDVRPVIERGEEPLACIRARLGSLTEGEGLLLVAPFLPAPLIELLGGEGYQYRFEPGHGGDWMVYFWREH
jgi:uncharacterized protein (DUF2249 family)